MGVQNVLWKTKGDQTFLVPAILRHENENKAITLGAKSISPWRS